MAHAEPKKGRSAGVERESTMRSTSTPQLSMLEARSYVHDTTWRYWGSIPLVSISCTRASVMNPPFALAPILHTSIQPPSPFTPPKLLASKSLCLKANNVGTVISLLSIVFPRPTRRMINEKAIPGP